MSGKCVLGNGLTRHGAKRRVQLPARQLCPRRLIRLNDQSSYRLTEYSGESLYVLDGAATPPRIVVAPPPLEQDK